MRCQVCGDEAKGTNYRVISCMSCKVFFQRYENKNIQNYATLKCRFNDGLCKINKQTRKYCMYCRLSACFRVGMQRKLINTPEENIRNRQQWESKRRFLIEQKYKYAQIVPLDLLQTDRSSLTVNQWTILSNITHVYDPLFEEHKQAIFHFHIHDHQKPIKTRLKLANYQQLVSTYFSFIIPFLERIPDYQSLESANRLTLIHHNMITLTGINSHYMTSTTKFIPYLDKNYAPIMNMMYGNEAVIENEKLRQKLDAIFHCDLIIVKLILVIFTFSNVTPCLSATSETILKSEDDEMMFSKALFRIQNKYIDVLWRYMLFRFRHEELVIHIFSNIIYNCLQVQNFSYQVAEQNDVHRDLFDGLTEEIETKLNLEDEL